MRGKIINLLRENIGRSVSGEELSRQLGISRTAIWKHVQHLKNAGYEIESVYKKGYILHSPPNLLLPGEIAVNLKTKWLGHNIIYQTSVKSTNDVAKQAALDNCPHGTIIVAEEQTGGRGRIDRGWFSPLGGGVWFSIVLRPPFLPQEAPKFTLFMATVLAKSLAKYPGLAVDIKWPNDILCQGKKLVGILTEMNAQMEAINHIVIGTGVNVCIAQDIIPAELQGKAGCVCEFVKEDVNRVKLLVTILKEFDLLYDRTLREGFDFMLGEWRKQCITLGRTVKVIAPDETFTGVALDIDETGALLVKNQEGEVRKVLAGDVSVRSADSKGYI